MKKQPVSQFQIPGPIGAFLIILVIIIGSILTNGLNAQEISLKASVAIETMEKRLEALKEPENTLREQYIAALDRHKKSIQELGDLTKLVAIEREIGSVNDPHYLDTESEFIDATVSNYRSLYRGKLEPLMRKRRADSIKIIKQVQADLKVTVSDVVKKGDLDSAKKIDALIGDLDILIKHSTGKSLVIDDLKSFKGPFAHGSDLAKSWSGKHKVDDEHADYFGRKIPIKSIFLASAPSEFQFEFKRPIYRLEIGVWSRPKSTMGFEIWAGEEKVWGSDTLPVDESKLLYIDIDKGTQTITLKTTDQGNYIDDHAIWFEPKVYFERN